MAPSLLRDLEPVVEQLLERHLATSKEWFPHEHVPYGRGRDAVVGEQWSEDDADLAGATIDDAVRSALLVNLLTEDNLPYYFRTIEQVFGPDGAWGTWVRRWTAEEGRHSMAIYSLSDGHAGDRSASPRALPDGAGVGRHDPRAARTSRTRSCTSRCRSWRPGSRTGRPAR